MINSFVFSQDIPLMTNILYEMITTLHDKILNPIYLYLFHNDTLAEKNSLNGHFNKPSLNKWKEVCHFFCQVKSSCRK